MLTLLVVAVALPVVASDKVPAELQWKLLRASPRIVTTSGAFGTASGVAVGARDGVAYILTAAHTVAEVAEREVQFFAEKGYPVPVKVYKAASVVLRVPDADVALVTVAVGNDAIVLAKLAAPGQRPKAFPAPVFAVGCSNGSAPTVEVDELLAKRFVRRPGNGMAFFWETAAPPVTGRSGGPLCDADGRVIGVCAANRDGRGYYAHADELHAALKKAGYAWLWGG